MLLRLVTNADASRGVGFLAAFVCQGSIFQNPMQVLSPNLTEMSHDESRKLTYHRQRSSAALL